MSTYKGIDENVLRASEIKGWVLEDIESGFVCSNGEHVETIGLNADDNIEIVWKLDSGRRTKTVVTISVTEID